MVKPEASTCGKGPEHTGFTAHPRGFLHVESKGRFPLFFFFFLAHNLQILSSVTRNRTCAPSSESTKS